MKRAETRLAFVGAGRAGSALACALSECGYPVTAIYSRSPAKAQALAESIGSTVAGSAVAAANAADVVFLTVPDARIASVAATIAAAGGGGARRTFIHCCASHGLDVLSALAQGGAGLAAVHPFAALSGADSASSLRGGFFGTESDANAAAVVTAIIAALDGTAMDMSKVNHALYHAGAVLIGNGVMALLAAGEEWLLGAGIEAEKSEAAALALAQSALNNARRTGLQAAITGPVVRGDAATVESHMRALRMHAAESAVLYETISRLILERFGSAASGDSRATISKVA